MAARSRRLRRGLGGSLLLLILAAAVTLFALPSRRAHAEAKVTIGPSEVSAALFVAGDVARLSKGPAGTEDLVLEKALQQLYADEPELDPATAEAYVADMRTLLAASSAPSPASLQLMAGNQRILAILSALEHPSGSSSALPAAAKLAVTHLAALALDDSADIFAGAEEPKYFEPLADARTNLTYTTFAPATVLRATHELAAGNRLFGEARDELWGGASEESSFSGWAELLKESKVLQGAALREVREAIEAGKGTLTAEPLELSALFSKAQTATQEQSCAHGGGEEEIGGGSIAGVPRLKCSGGALYEAAHVPRACGEKSKCEAELAQLQHNAADQERAIAEEHAEMVAAAELLRPSDNAAAALQQATAQAQTQITEEETAYAQYEAEKAEKEEIAGGVRAGLGIGTSVLALATENYSEGIGGLIGVGFELYEEVEGGLSNPPPGPQEIALQDLADLSTQLSGFQQYTQEAFHAINTQLAQLSSQLARENYELRQELGQLGERLVKEQGTIFALQNQVRELFAAQTKANLQSTIEDSVGWLRRTGEPLSGQRFQEALVALHKDATEIANGALVNSSETQPYSFEGAARQLTARATGEPSELGEDMSFLARFPFEQGWVTSEAPSSLANSTFWSESSRAYAQLMLENAGHVTAADIASLKGLEKEGLTLEKVQGAWSAPTAGGGSQTGNTVLDKALANFEAAADGSGVDGTSSVQTLLQDKADGSFEEALERTVKVPGSPLANPTGVELWGGGEQSFSASSVADAEYPALKWHECSGSATSNGTQPMPQGFIQSLPATLIDGVRLGVIGAPGSGDPLVLEACRKISQSVSGAGTVSAPQFEREGCPGFDRAGLNDCNVLYNAQASNERQAETVTETLTVKEGGNTIAEPTVGECRQTALFSRGSGHYESYDPETNGAYGIAVGRTSIGTSFETERHVGLIGSVYFGEEGGSVYIHSSYSTGAFEGAVCPYEGGTEKAGVEYATYNAGADPLGAAEETILQQVQGKLRALQREAYGAALGALTNPGRGNPLESLAGARALVQSYVKLGLPQAVDSDLALQGDVEGLGAQFLDPEPGSPRPLPEEVAALDASWIQRLEASSGSELEELLKEDLIDEVATRSSAWAHQIAEQVKPYVEGQVPGFGAGAEPVDERSALVESTLQRLSLTRDVLSEARAPTAETLAPAGIGTSEATVRGEVDPNGGTVESCIFEYGASNLYGHSVECSSIPGAGEKAVVVSAKITGWTPEGSFHERVVLKTWGGTSYGEDVKVQLEQSAEAPSGGLVMADTSTTGASIGQFTAEELPPGVPLPEGAEQIVGSLSFTVNVSPGGTARVRIALPSGSAPNALYKLEHVTGGGQEYVEIPSSLYELTGETIELTLLDGGPDDEDHEANGVIVDPLVPVVMTKVSSPPPSTGETPGPEPPANPSPAPNPVSQPVTAGTPPAPTATTPPITNAVTPTPRKTVSPPKCVRNGSATVHVADLVTVPAGARIESSEIQVGGQVVARLAGSSAAASVSFPGAGRGHHEVVVIIRLSNGQTIKKKLDFHQCASLARAPGECVRDGSVTVHVADLVKVPRGARIESSEVSVGGRVVARLAGRSTAAAVSFPGAGSRHQVALTVRLSNGHTIKKKVGFRTCR